MQEVDINTADTITMKAKKRSAKKKRTLNKIPQRATLALVTGLINSILSAISAIPRVPPPLSEMKSAETIKFGFKITPPCSMPLSQVLHTDTPASTEHILLAVMSEPVSKSVQLLNHQISILLTATVNGQKLQT